MARYASTTKSGPGRFHRDGLKRNKRPKAPLGHWLGQHVASAEKKARRNAVGLLGRRQYLKLKKSAARGDSAAAQKIGDAWAG